MYSQWTRAVRRLTVSVSTTFTLLLFTPGVYAAEVIEEVIVTGTKREATIQDVPIAVTAITGEQLEKQFRTDILALSDMSPGVSLAQVAGFRAVAGGIRGTGQNSILVTQDSSVVVLVDEFALANVQSQFVEMFDIERVEVYRGPQGTLFGKSATGGAISIVTKRPVMNEMSAEIGGQFGRFDPDDGETGDIGKVRLAFNLPLIDDTLAIRAAAVYDYDDGYYTNDKDTATFPGVVPLYELFGEDPVNPPFPPDLNLRTTGAGEDLNGTDVWAGKIKALWQPNDRYEAYFIYEILRDDSDSPPGVNESEAAHVLPLLGFPSIQAAGHGNELSTGVTQQCIEGNPEGLCMKDGHRVDVDGYYLHQTYEADIATFKLLAGYREQEEILPSTYTGEAYLSLFDAGRNTTRDNLQIEFRAASKLDGPFNFVAAS
jgi:iron complex outermembrane receptor protein